MNRREVFLGAAAFGIAGIVPPEVIAAPATLPVDAGLLSVRSAQEYWEMKKFGMIITNEILQDLGLEPKNLAVES